MDTMLRRLCKRLIPLAIISVTLVYYSVAGADEQPGGVADLKEVSGVVCSKWAPS